MAVVPDVLKEAKLIPVFKKGDTSLPSNFRPITLLSIFNKLLKKNMCKRSNRFFFKYDILYK